MASTETLLLFGIAAFYLIDTSMLLYRDEVVFVKSGAHWRAPVGTGFMLAGRYPALPGLIVPGAPIFRSVWCAPAAANEPNTELLLQILRPLRWPARFIALLLFLVLPLALFVNMGPQLMLALLCLLYVTSCLSVAYVARRRFVLGLSRKDVIAIAFDVIACPPFAINLVRRVTLRCGLTVSADQFAVAVLNANAHAKLVRVLEARSDAMPKQDDSNVDLNRSDDDHQSFGREAP